MLAPLLGDLQNLRSSTVYRVHTRRLRFPTLPTHRHDFLLCSSSIGHTRCPIGHVDHRSTYGRNMAFNRCCTRLHRLPGFLASPPCVGGTPTCLPRAKNCDTVIHDVSKCHVSPSLSLDTLASHVSSVASSASRHLADR